MIDEFSTDQRGWARFSDDNLMRYRLARSLTDHALSLDSLGNVNIGSRRRVVFLMLNPSTADAFKPDPTVGRCMDFARRWGADTLEVVNLFAFRTSKPRELKIRASDQRGADVVNDSAIATAVHRAYLVVAAWGNDGALAGRGELVGRRLRQAGVVLHVLGEQNPTHPLARGKHRIPDDRQLQVWT